MSAERRKRGQMEEIREKTGFKTVRVGGYSASCVNHGLSATVLHGVRQMEPYYLADQYLMPVTCRTQAEYDDALSHATRVASKAHKKTGCTHDLVVTLTVS